MSMSTHISAFRAPDERWKKHKAVWDACEEAGVPPPGPTLEFFNGEPPDDRGVEIELEGDFKWHSDYASGFEVPIAALPEGTTHVRFWNSW